VFGQWMRLIPKWNKSSILFEEWLCFIWVVEGADAAKVGLRYYADPLPVSSSYALPKTNNQTTRMPRRCIEGNIDVEVDCWLTYALILWLILENISIHGKRRFTQGYRNYSEEIF
jgi:hypothetical protein